MESQKSIEVYNRKTRFYNTYTMITYLDDVKSPLLRRLTGMSENELHRLYEPDEGLFVAESPNVIIRALDAGYEPVELLVDAGNIDSDSGVSAFDDLIKRVDAKKADIYALPSDEISRIRGFGMTRGAVCLMRRRALPDIDTVISDARRVALLEDVMNPTNLGAIFRSAAALGIEAVIITKGCSDPLYKRASRVSMGTVFQVPWTVASEAVAVLDKLHLAGFTSAAMALDDRAIRLGEDNLGESEKIVIVLGSEGYGLREETIACCHNTVMIPMSNEVDSLNVAAAAAVTFWELR